MRDLIEVQIQLAQDILAVLNRAQMHPHNIMLVLTVVTSCVARSIGGEELADEFKRLYERKFCGGRAGPRV